MLQAMFWQQDETYSTPSLERMLQIADDQKVAVRRYICLHSECEARCIHLAAICNLTANSHHILVFEQCSSMESSSPGNKTYVISTDLSQSSRMYWDLHQCVYTTNIHDRKVGTLWNHQRCPLWGVRHKFALEWNVPRFHFILRKCNSFKNNHVFSYIAGTTCQAWTYQMHNYQESDTPMVTRILEICPCGWMFIEFTYKYCWWNSVKNVNSANQCSCHEWHEWEKVRWNLFVCIWLRPAIIFIYHLNQVDWVNWLTMSIHRSALWLLSWIAPRSSS